MNRGNRTPGNPAFARYTERLKACIAHSDEHQLVTFFSIADAPPQLLADLSKQNVEAECWKCLGDFPTIVESYILHLSAMVALHEGRFVDAYNHQINLVPKFIDVLKDQQYPWMMGALHTIVKDTKEIAIKADKYLANAKSSKSHPENEKLRDAENTLKGAFTICVNDRKNIRDPESRRSGFLYIVVVLFKIYFQLNTLRLCKNIIKVIERPGFVGEEECFVKSELVSYKYYVGRLNMFEDQYNEAEENLSYALLHCHRDAVRNKRRILNSLVPVMLLLGKLPTKKLLQKYEMTHFEGLVRSVRQGDLKEFNCCIEQYQGLFIAHGTYLILEKLKVLVYRSLFRRMHCILNTEKIHLSKFESVLRWLESPMELDEIECILANLIFKGYIKGYISHKAKILVLAKTNPFPIAAIVKAS